MRFVAVAMVLLAGCTHFIPPAPAQPRPNPTPVDASFGRAWDAVIDLFATENIPIRTMERASGFVAAEISSIPRSTPSEKEFAASIADCGYISARNGGFRYLPWAALYNVVVRGDSSRSTVRVTVKYTNFGASWTPKGERGSELPCESSGVFETRFEGSVKQRAESKR